MKLPENFDGGVVGVGGGGVVGKQFLIVLISIDKFVLDYINMDYLTNR